MQVNKRLGKRPNRTLRVYSVPGTVLTPPLYPGHPDELSDSTGRPGSSADRSLVPLHDLSRSHPDPRLTVTRRTALPYWASLERLTTPITPYLSTLDSETRPGALLTTQSDSYVTQGLFYRAGPQGKHSTGPGPLMCLSPHLTSLTIVSDSPHIQLLESDDL